jgi:hypothetical protein
MGCVGLKQNKRMKTQHCYTKHKHCESSFCSLEIDRLVPEWTKLLKSLKGDISDDYRCSDDPDDNTPGMQVTIGFTPSTDDKDCSWHYQTGDNSYTGGAYGHVNWAVIYLYRRSNCRELAKDAADQIAESVSQH